MRREGSGLSDRRTYRPLPKGLICNMCNNPGEKGCWCGLGVRRAGHSLNPSHLECPSAFREILKHPKESPIGPRYAAAQVSELPKVRAKNHMKSGHLMLNKRLATEFFDETLVEKTAPIWHW